ncbi:MAG: ATP-binding protein, partial [Candidatus Poribacteria bacterium]
EQIIGGYCPKVIHGSDEPILGCPLEEAVEKGNICVEREFYDQNSNIWVSSAVYPVGCKTKNGREIFIHMVYDITKQKQAEESLWETNELLETIFSTTHLMIAYLDRDFNFIRVNRAYAEAYMHIPDFFFGKNYFELYHQEDERLIFNNVLDNGEPYFIYAKPFKFAEHNGLNASYWNWSVHPVKDSSGNVKGIILLFLDVTQYKQMEERLLWSQKMESVGKLTAGIAHEIGNPLNSISTLAQILQKKSKDTFIKDNLQLMGTNIDRIARVMRDMMDFAHPIVDEKKLIQVNDVVNSAIEISRYDKRARSIKIVMELASNMQEAFVVGDQLLQVFTNIIFNSFDAMCGVGELTIKTEQESDMICISFTDTGVGIREDIISKIFDPFFTTKDIGHGTGLGLSISYGIIKSFNGEIAVQSRYGSGSTFTVKLPVKRIEEKENGGAYINSGR